MNPQEKDNRPENRDEPRKEKAEKPARLGKEAKIGAAVILVLLCVFAGVVVARLKGSDDKKTEPVAANKPAKPLDDPFGREGKSKLFASHSPTKVTPAPSTKQPTSFDSALDKWKLPAAKSEPKQAQSRYSTPSAPPAFASDLPKPPRPSRYDDVTTARPANADSDSTSRFRKTPNALRPESSDASDLSRSTPTKSDRSVLTRRDMDQSDAGGFASAGAPRELPPHREHSRYDDRSAALLPPTPDPENSSYADSTRRSTQTEPVSQYGDDIPRSPSRSGYDRDDRPHRSRSSFASRSTQREDGKYEVEPNDSYWTISEKTYGTGAYYKALAELNRGKSDSENRLLPGAIVSTPSVTELEKSYPDLCPKAGRREAIQSRNSMVSTRQSYRSGRTYTVAEGDTLFNIARYELGKASRWAEIYDLNREALGKDFNYLTPGMKLTLPDNEKSDVLTKRPGETYR